MTDSKQQPIETASVKEAVRERGRLRRKDISSVAKVSHKNLTKRNDLLPKLVLETIAIDNLKLPARKLRKTNAAHLREIANSIAVHGFVIPILIGLDNTVVDGLSRVLAAREHNLHEIPCLQIGHLSDVEQRTLRLAVNRLAEKGEWDLPALAFEYEELIVLDAPVETTGFSHAEIDAIIIVNEAVGGQEIGSLAPDACLPVVSRLGDVYQLDTHRIVCGDARSVDTLALLMSETSMARLVFTDEPYNVPIQGHVTSKKHRSFEMAAGEMTDSEFFDFNIDWMKAAVAWLQDGGLLATFIDWRGLSTVTTAAVKLDLEQLNHVVWAKTNAGMGSLYRSQTEHLPIFKKGSAAHVNNVKLGKAGRWRSSLWTYPGASSFGSDARRGLKDHPTVKPTIMLQDALLDVTNRGEVVLDPFLGSGSTLIACEMTGRVCRGIEIDPLYVDTIIRRFEAKTGKKAILEKTGESFETLKAARQG